VTPGAGAGAPGAGRPDGHPIRVLIVDDSAVIRMAYRVLLEEEPGFEVVGEAGDPYEARELILAHDPDVLTLDIEMPRMDGITFLRRLMQFKPTPVVLISSVAERGSALAIEALHIGAAEVVDKPMTALARQRFGPTLFSALRAAVESRPHPRAGAGPTVPMAGVAGASLIAIGASTGGPAQFLDMMPRLPKNLPPIVIVQHMPVGFTAALSDRLALTSGLDVKEARTGEVLAPGMVRVAPGGRHTIIAGTPRSLRLAVQDGPMVNFHRPSIDLFFQTVTRACGPTAVGVILTGMGEDGARGLLAMRQAGAMTLGQDEATSVVYGMPRAAWEIGAVARQVAISDMPAAIVDAVRTRSAPTTR
jgi:two-component system chemotaxis response regulator CheB